MFKSYVLINFTHDLLYFSSISIVPDINYFQLSNLEISILQNCNVYENEISISIKRNEESGIYLATHMANWIHTICAWVRNCFNNSSKPPHMQYLA